MSKIKFKSIYLAYLILATLTFFYIKHVVDRKDVDVRDIKQEVSVPEVKNIDVTLEIDLSGSRQLYKFKLKNTDTVENLLQEARKNNLINYEKTVYLNKVELTDPVSNRNYMVFYNGGDITAHIEEQYLEDSKIYIVR